MGQSGAYLQPGKRDVEEEEGKGNGGPQKGHEKEGDGSEASSTILGYSLPVSWGPRCTRTILFLFLFFSVLVPVRTSCLSASLFSYFPPRLFHRFHLFSSFTSFSLRSVSVYLSLFLSPSVSSFVGQPPSRRSSCSSGSSAPSLRLFSLVPSACPSRLLYEVIMYRIRYHLIAILGIEKSLVVTVPNCTVYLRCENFHFFFYMKIFALTILRNVCSTLSRIFNIERVYFRDSRQKRSTGELIKGKRGRKKNNETNEPKFTIPIRILCILPSVLHQR